MIEKWENKFHFTILIFRVNFQLSSETETSSKLFETYALLCLHLLANRCWLTQKEVAKLSKLGILRSFLRKVSLGFSPLNNVKTEISAVVIFIKMKFVYLEQFLKIKILKVGWFAVCCILDETACLSKHVFLTIDFLLLLLVLLLNCELNIGHTQARRARVKTTNKVLHKTVITPEQKAAQRKLMWT